MSIMILTIADVQWLMSHLNQHAQSVFMRIKGHIQLGQLMFVVKLLKIHSVSNNYANDVFLWFS